MILRICSICDDDKPIDEFYRRCSHCKQCARRRARNTPNQNAAEHHARLIADRALRDRYLQNPQLFAHRGTWPTNETWRPIPGYVGSYEASDCGRIRSLIFLNGRVWKWRKVPLVLKYYSHRFGYQSVTLVRNGKHITEHIHRLVLLAFNGEPPNGHVAGHRDGDPSNNYLTNLRWITYKENEDDKRRHGRSMPGSRNHQAKLTEAIVIAMRQDRMTGLAFHRIAKKYGISVTTAHRAVTGIMWKHVPMLQAGTAAEVI